MIDYVEGLLKMEQLLRELKRALIANDPMTARDLCAQIVAETRLVDKQIVVQFPKETGH